MARRFLASLLLLQACVSVPEHELAQVACTSGLDHTAQDALNSGDVTENGWPVCDWWRQFGDEKLNALIDSALVNSPSLKLAEARLKAAGQVALDKRAALYPQLYFDGNDNYQHFAKDGFFRTLAPQVPAVINDVTLNLTYRWELDFWGKNRKILEAALGNARAAEAELDAAKLILTTAIAYDYAELQFLLRKKELLEQKNQNDAEIWKVRTSRQTNAIDTALTTLGAQIEQLNNETLLVDVDNQIQDHIHELKALAGIGQDATLEIEKTNLNVLAATLPTNISLDLLARRPDLAAQKQRVESTASLIGAAKTDFYPSVNLLGFAGLESLSWERLFKISSFNGSLEPAVHLPIFTAGKIKANLMEKVAEFNQAVENYNDLILQAAKEVADNLSTFIRIQKELDLRVVTIEAVAKQEALIKRRFDHAIDSKISYLQAQNNLIDTKIILTNLEYGKQLANILLIRSLGGGTHE